MRGDGMRPWRILRAILCWIVAVWLLAPLVVVVVISFSSAPFLQFPPPGFSLRWYEQLFSTPAWTNSLLVSVEIMGPAAFFATVLGTAASYADFLRPRDGRKAHNRAHDGGPIPMRQCQTATTSTLK